MAEQECIHIYHELLFHEIRDQHTPKEHIKLLGGQYIEKHHLEQGDILDYLAEVFYKANAQKIINVRIKRENRIVETEYHHYEPHPMEAIY